MGRCLNCSAVLSDDEIKKYSSANNLGHQLYGVAYKKGKFGLEFRLPLQIDLDGNIKAEECLKYKCSDFNFNILIPTEPTSTGLHDSPRNYEYGLRRYVDCFNPHQLLTLITYVEIINEAKALIQVEYKPEKADAIIAYLSLVLDRCADANCRLAHWIASRISATGASAQHSLNLMWSYPETNGIGELWQKCAEVCASDYKSLCALFGTKTGSTGIPGVEKHELKSIQIDSASADNLTHIPDNFVDAIIIDPPYYATIQYAELSDFFYVWMKRTLGDILPELFYLELTDKDREAVANPSRFRNMGESPEKLANQDYEAKMALAFAEYYRVLRDDGVMTVQFNHKDSGAWDILAYSLIEAGFEITASWAVSTENPQNLHQAQNRVVGVLALAIRLQLL